MHTLIYQLPAAGRWSRPAGTGIGASAAFFAGKCANEIYFALLRRMNGSTPGVKKKGRRAFRHNDLVYKIYLVCAAAFSA